MTDTLKSICEQCAHLNNPQLDFIPDELPRHKKIIRRDLRELISAASAELEKAVVSLAGSIFESVLYTFLQGQQAYIVKRRGGFRFKPDQSLQNYVEVFNRWFRDSLPNAQLPDIIVTYRDLIHINRELNESDDICAEASRAMIGILDAFLRELTTFAGASLQ